MSKNDIGDLIFDQKSGPGPKNRVPDPKNHDFDPILGSF